ncbi:hypothetical protein M8J75_004308 [Diaphorina citri]|nr:hypothetical protein M8J75_004308 [Diaphorina citri]
MTSSIQRLVLEKKAIMLIQAVFLLCGVASCLCLPSLTDRITDQVVARVDTLAIEGSLTFDNENILETFKAFIVKRGRQYANDEEIKERFEYFKQDGHKKHERYGTSEFSDRSPEEILCKTGFKWSERTYERIVADREKVEKMLMEVEKDGPVPDAWDWRKKNVTGPAGDQADCGSCWAFSIAGMLEGQYAIKTGKLVEFSKSQLVECAKQCSGCGGCDGLEQPIEYTHQAGLESEKDYPYRNGNGEKFKCAYDKSKVKLFTGKDFLYFNGSETMKKILYKYGPLSVGLNSHLIHFYNGTPIRKNDETCSPYDLGHAVLLVGYGKQDDIPYWLVRNSWGPIGPDEGFFKIERGNNACGIEQIAGYATIDVV